MNNAWLRTSAAQPKRFQKTSCSHCGRLPASHECAWTNLRGVASSQSIVGWTAAAVFAGAFLSRWLALEQPLNLLWIPAGVSFAATWKYGPVALLGVALGIALWALLSYGAHPILVPGAIAIEVTVTWLIVWTLRLLLRRFGQAAGETSGPVKRLRWLLCFYAASVFVGAPLAAVGGSAVFAAAQLHAELGAVRAALAYWISEALALLLVAPTLLSWLPREPSDRNFIPYGLSKLVRDPRYLAVDRAVILLVALITLGVLALRAWGLHAFEAALLLAYLLAMAFCALRHGARTTYTTLLLSALLLSTALTAEPDRGFVGGLKPHEVSPAIFEIVALLFVATALTQILQAVSSDRAEGLRRLEEQSTRDATTGLLNEFGFEQWLEQAPKAESLLVVSAFFGRRARIEAITRQIPLSELRRAIGTQLQELGAAAAVRLEGEHYALVFREAEGSSGIAQRMARALSSLRVTGADGQRVTLHPALAALRLPPGVRPTTAQLLTSLSSIEVPSGDMRSAQLKVREFSPEIETALRERSELLAAVERGVRRGRIVLFAQPIQRCDGRDGEMVSIEVLSRMPDARGNLILPSEFLPAVAQLGLLRVFDRQVIERVFSWYAHHRTAYERTRQCAINLSASSVEDVSLPDFIAERLAHYRLGAERFCFEIVESTAVADLDRAQSVLMELRQLGLRIAVDDFGTGFATFSYLKRFPVDELKIDGSFIETVAQDPVSEEVVRSTVAVAKRLGLRTIAECVSHPGLGEIVAELGVDYVQGNAVAFAEPIERLYGLPESALEFFDGSESPQTCG